MGTISSGQGLAGGAAAEAGAEASGGSARDADGAAFPVLDAASSCLPPSSRKPVATRALKPNAPPMSKPVLLLPAVALVLSVAGLLVLAMFGCVPGRVGVAPGIRLVGLVPK